MPMRSDCRNFESRSYDNGEVVRKCRLDLAPEAPWRCPADCPAFEQRRFDAGWAYGTLVGAGGSPEPEPEGEDVAALLDEAEDIVNAAAPEIIAEAETRRPRARRPRPSRGRRRR